ncbi:uncharacterized protein [Littorina saxatilis]|uniref:Uncharacterized protein n=1 Tax=Littorina saxatilis TaxID=31220 RepID=A0AAN9GLZ8_9CAEN
MQTFKFLHIFVFQLASFPVVLSCDGDALENCNNAFATAASTAAQTQPVICGIVDTFWECLNTACSNNVPAEWSDNLGQNLAQMNVSCPVSGETTTGGGANNGNTSTEGDSGAGVLNFSSPQSLLPQTFLVFFSTSIFV